MTAKIKRSESDEQCDVFAVLAANERRYPFLKWIHASQNGASASSPAAAALRKRQGQKKGIPDIFVPIAVNGCHGLFIEMKVNSNKLTPEQNEFFNFVFSNGYIVGLAYSANQALAYIEQYLGITLAK